MLLNSTLSTAAFLKLIHFHRRIAGSVNGDYADSVFGDNRSVAGKLLFATVCRPLNGSTFNCVDW